MSADELKISTQEEREATAAEAMKDGEVFDALFELLEGSSRSKRQRAATVIAIIGATDATRLDGYAPELAQAANMPEEQTRWDCLNALASMAQAGLETGNDALMAAEDNLFDDRSGIVREAALRYLCVYGATDPTASDEVWPSLDEAIQCHHGNAEFNDMLTWLVGFAGGNISAETSAALAERFAFDAEHASGTLRMRSQQIVEIHKKRK